MQGISPRTLSLRLRALEEEGIVERHTFSEVPPRVEYALTEKGRALLPIVEGMRSYGEEWLGEGEHGRCGARQRAPRSRSPSEQGSALQDAAALRRRRAGATGAGRSVQTMRSRQLETALTEFVAEAADRLQAEIDGGAEVRFELAEKSARRGEGAARLYSYRALTGAFIERARGAAREPARARRGGRSARRLRRPRPLPGGERRWRRAGADEGLRARRRGAEAAARRCVRRADRLRPSLRAAQHGERSRRRLARLEHSTQASTSEVTLLATLHGLTIASEELAVDAGPDDRPARRAARRARRRATVEMHLLVVFTADDCDVDDALARGREVLKDLLRALRLFGDGRVTLGALAWARVGAGAWNPLALGAGGRPHGMLVVSAEQEDELRAFCNLVSRRAPHGNELAWALRRFELGCERGTGYEALSDHLLALRALLEPEGPASGLLAGRIAALCATPEDRAKLTKRMLKAQALERAAIAGTAAEHAAGLNLAREVADHLRALLRDVICGHLDPNLAALADELLATPIRRARRGAWQETDALAVPEPAPIPAGHPLDQLTQSALPV